MSRGAKLTQRSEPEAEQPRPSGLSDAPTNTGSRGTRILGVVAIVGVIATTAWAFAWSPQDEPPSEGGLGQSIRIMYVHVGTVSIAYLFLVGCAVFSAWVLWKRSQFADVAAHACAEIGVLLLGLTLITGSLWGKITWGAFWVWDARLTTTALLFLMYVGYLAVRAATPEPRARATRAAIVGIASAVLIPVVHKSVEWWSSLHQESTLFGTLNPKLGGAQLFTLMLSMATMLAVCGWLFMHRFRVGWLSQQAEEHGLADAIAERRAEGVAA
jgi:heme exporter protein C